MNTEINDGGPARHYSQELDSSTMTKEQQRIKIAEACGWDGIFKDDDQVVCGHMPFQSRHTEWVENRPVPDYLNDLNAMHEAEKMLTREAFLRILGLWKD